MAKLRVDVDDLLSKVESMREDGFVTAELEITEGAYESDNVLIMSAVDIEDDKLNGYGELSNIDSSI